LHLYDGITPAMEGGDVLGHETMGEVVEVGPGVNNLKVGERVVVPFTSLRRVLLLPQRLLFRLRGVAVNSSVAAVTVQITSSLLRGLCAACPRTVLVRPSAATSGRVHLRVALLRECERGGSKRDSDRKAQSSHGGHSYSPYRND
jgi:NADPH:quinone reductase-like Zn-dependent oxidoreductase